MCFKNSFSVAYIQVNLGSIFISWMRWVLSKFNEILLTLNHLFKYMNTVVMSLITSVGLVLVTIIPVSSANRIGLDLLSYLYREERTKDLAWILVERHALFYPILKLSDD
jgi:hypothetical protein